MILIAVFAALAALLSVPSATAGPGDYPGAGMSSQQVDARAADNLNAGIVGVSSRAPGPCPYLAACIYTDTFYGGRMFVLSQCGRYTLTNWDGWGSIYNHQSPGAWVDLQDQNRNPIRGFSSGDASEALDYSPVWYLWLC